jgi:mono/diheme cytochrome c family protein
MIKLKATAILSLLLLLSFGLKAQVKHKVVHHSSLALSMARGKQVYAKTCISCHQADAGGVPMMNPPLVQTEYVLGDKVRLIKIVLNGFNEDVEINGQKYSNNMPSHDFLSDQQIADVLTYVRNSFTNKAPAITATQVKTVRATNKKS